MANTTNQNYPKPVADNDLSADVTVIQTAFDMIDIDVKSLVVALATKSATGHGHAVDDVAGLQGLIDGKSATSHTHALDDLTDVDGAAGASAGMLLQKTALGFVPVSVAAVVGATVTGLVDAGLDAKMDKSANLGDVTDAPLALGNLGGIRTAIPDAILQDQKASGTDGGSATAATWHTRDINTVVHDPDSLVALASNQFIPSVDMWVRFEAPAFNVGRHRGIIYNITDSVAVTPRGSNQYTAATVQTNTNGFVFLEADKSYELWHHCGGAQATNGLGVNSSETIEIYTTLMFWRA